jgi:hypothetical protein
LPATGDSPGRGSVASTLVGMVSGNGGVLRSQPNPTAEVHPVSLDTHLSEERPER